MTRRGVAMLIVLAASAIILSAASIIARSRSTAALSEVTHDRLRLALSAADAAEAPVLAWLERASRRVVLPPDAAVPLVSVLDDTLRIAGQDARITVTAWDQTAMHPAVDLAEIPGYARLLSRADRDAAGWIGHEAPGLDLAHPAVPVFPSRDRPHALGARLATHSPPPSSGGQRGGRVPAININTAPEPHLRAVYAHLGISGVESVLQKRAAGERAEADQQRGERQHALRLVGSSTVWAVRVDATVGGVRASTWSVYTLRAGAWIREQRLVIAD